MECRDDTAEAESGLRSLQAADIIGLPAMERDGDAERAPKGSLRINAQGGVGFTGKAIRRGDFFGGGHGDITLTVNGTDVAKMFC